MDFAFGGGIYSTIIFWMISKAKRTVGTGTSLLSIECKLFCFFATSTQVMTIIY